jgi:hypothetical protein
MPTCNVHRLHTLQWWQRGGRIMSHFSQYEGLVRGNSHGTSLAGSGGRPLIALHLSSVPYKATRWTSSAAQNGGFKPQNPPWALRAFQVYCIVECSFGNATPGDEKHATIKCQVIMTTQYTTMEEWILSFARHDDSFVVHHSCLNMGLNVVR